MPADADPPIEGHDHPIRELDDAGCEAVPADLVELHEVLEWEAAVEAKRSEGRS